MVVGGCSWHPTLAAYFGIGKGCVVPEPPVVEAPLAKLELLAKLRREHAQQLRDIAAKAGPRPRPWHAKARPDQLVPKDGDWQVHLYLAGRGWGKVRRVLTGWWNRPRRTRILNGQ